MSANVYQNKDIWESKSLKMLITLFTSLMFILLLFTDYSYSNSILIYVGMMSIGLLLIIRSYQAHNYGLLLLFAYLIKYIYLFYFVFFESVSFGPFTYHNNAQGYYQLALTIFPSLIVIYYFLTLKPMYHIVKKQVYNNKTLYYLCLLICFIFTILGHSGKNIMEAGYYGSGEGSLSTTFEYAIIFAVGAFIFSGEKPYRKRILYGLSIFYVLMDLSYGGRVSSVQLILAIWFLDFQYRNIPLKYIIILAVVGYVFFSAWGVFRGDVSGDFSSAVTTITSGQEAGYYSIDDGYVLYSGARVVNMVNDGIMSMEQRVLITLNFIVSIILPTSMQNTTYDIRWFMSDRYGSGGGGFYTGFLYVYGSYILIILVSMFIAKIVTKMYSKERFYSFASVYSVFVCTTCPRWIGYNVVALCKYCIIGAIVISLLMYYHKKHSSVLRS